MQTGSMRYLQAGIDKEALERWVSYLVVERGRTHFLEVRGQHLSNEKSGLSVEKRVHYYKPTSLFGSTVKNCLSPNRIKEEILFVLTTLVVGQHPPGH